VIIERMAGRRVHPASGRTYHLVFNPPPLAGKDDETGEDLIQRDDDKEATVRKRLAVYHEQTKPLVSFYETLEKSGASVQVVSIDGQDSVQEIRSRLARVLSK
jgi:adenylate kinase